MLRLEGGLEMMRETLTRLGYPESLVGGYTDAVRHSRYDHSVSSNTEQRALERMLNEVCARRRLCGLFGINCSSCCVSLIV